MDPVLYPVSAFFSPPFNLIISNYSIHILSLFSWYLQSLVIIDEEYVNKCELHLIVG